MDQSCDRNGRSSSRQGRSYEVDRGRVLDVLIQGPEIHGTVKDGHTF